MVKLIGPLLSLDARGQFAKTLTYAKLGMTSYTKAYAVPTNPNTPDQIGQRLIISQITKNWQETTQAERATWDPLSAQLKTSNYHAYLRHNARTWRRDIPPVATYDPSINDPDEPFFTTKKEPPTPPKIEIIYPMTTGTPFVVLTAWSADENTPPTHSQAFLPTYTFEPIDYYGRITAQLTAEPPTSPIPWITIGTHEGHWLPWTCPDP